MYTAIQRQHKEKQRQLSQACASDGFYEHYFLRERTLINYVWFQMVRLSLVNYHFSLGSPHHLYVITEAFKPSPMIPMLARPCIRRVLTTAKSHESTT
jgi:fumarate reductase subunit C